MITTRLMAHGVALALLTACGGGESTPNGGSVTLSGTSACDNAAYPSQETSKYVLPRRIGRIVAKR